MGRVVRTFASKVADEKARSVTTGDLIGDKVELLKIEEAAKILAVSPGTVRRLIENGSIPVVCISAKEEYRRPAVRVTRQTLDLFVRQRIAFRHDLVRIDDAVAVVRERAMDGAA